MSDYSCNKHGHDFHEDCAACEAADDWAAKERRIAELEGAAQDVVANRGTNIPLEASIDALAEALLEADDE